MSERFFRVTCAAMFVFGIVLGVPGTVVALPDFGARLQPTIPERGLLISSLFVGLLVGSAVSGPVVDRFGRRASLAGSALLVAAWLPAVALAPTFAWAATSLAALGLASAGVNTASNAIASELFPQQRGRRMNIVALAVGAGGLSLPAMTALLAGRVPWEAVLVGAAMLAAVVGLLAIRIDVPPQVGAGAPLSLRNITAVIRQPGVPAFAVVIALGGAHEASIAGWTTTYLVTGGFAAETATWGLAIFWAGLIVGRFLLSRNVDRGKERAVLWAAVAGAACVVLMVLARAPALMLAAPGLAGCAIAIVMPTTLAAAGERYPGYAGTLFGVLLTMAQAGAMIVPAFVGVVADRGGVRAGLSILVATHAVIAVTTWRVARRRIG